MSQTVEMNYIVCEMFVGCCTPECQTSLLTQMKDDGYEIPEGCEFVHLGRSRIKIDRMIHFKVRCMHCVARDKARDEYFEEALNGN